MDASYMTARPSIEGHGAPGDSVIRVSAHGGEAKMPKRSMTPRDQDSEWPGGKRKKKPKALRDKRPRCQKAKRPRGQTGNEAKGKRAIF